MLIENAVVIGFESGLVTVKCQSKSACGSCEAKAVCGSSVLSELTGLYDEHIFTIETITPIAIGEQVEIGLPERSLLKSIYFAYILPLISVLISAFIGHQVFQHELLVAVFIFFCMGLTFGLVRVYMKKNQKKSAFKPILIRVLNNKSVHHVDVL